MPPADTAMRTLVTPRGSGGRGLPDGTPTTGHAARTAPQRGEGSCVGPEGILPAYSSGVEGGEISPRLVTAQPTGDHHNSANGRSLYPNFASRMISSFTAAPPKPWGAWRSAWTVCGAGK